MELQMQDMLAWTEQMPEEKENHINYSFKVGENIFIRVEKNVVLDSISKQRWLLTAIEEKLKNEKRLQKDAIPRERQMVVRIKNSLNKILNKRIETIKKFRKHYSKKQWILEAILEKLDREQSKHETIKE